jgi:uncharacterized secreted protein with C-terminal beta-propeller domain
MKRNEKFGLDKTSSADSQAKKFIMFGIIFLALYGITLGVLISLSAPTPSVPDTKLQYFSSYNELVDYFSKANTYTSNYYRGGIMDIAIAPMAKATNAVQESATGIAADYSKTNVQVAGVDEADIIKNDGKYIYAIAQNKLFIVEAYPAENAKIIATIDLNNKTPIEMFISEDSSKLLLFANEYSYYGPRYGDVMPMAKVAANTSIAKMPWWGGTGAVIAQIYDISNKSEPKVEKEVSFEGSYLTSRLIGDNAYFVINSYPRYYAYPMAEDSGVTDSNGSDENGIIPLMSEDGVVTPIAKSTEIGIMPRMKPTSFVTLASINFSTLKIKKKTVTATAQNVYASQDNLYFADTYWDYAEYDYNGPLPAEVAGLVKSIYYPVISTIEKTTINKFSLDNGSISFVGSGLVPGTILNQFSMDEYKDNFRIATTTQGNWNDPNSQSKNNVYILDKEMNLAGSIEGIAPGEKIYSTRFLGDKGYMVTFKKVDPLFVLDLSNPEEPKILGKLKIPGYSDYLHPIDETHIIGIGKDTVESSYGDFAWYQGIKMAIFDVSDVENPIEMHKIIVGDRGTDSEALHDHKAFLFDKERELLVMPITLAEISAKEKEKQINNDGVVSSPAYGTQTFQGAIIYKLNLEQGFVERGRISHVTKEEELKSGYYYDYTSQIRRSLYMDNVLYTFSDNAIKANALDSLDNISEVRFPKQQDQYYGGIEEPIPVDIGGGIGDTVPVGTIVEGDASAQ